MNEVRENGWFQRHVISELKRLSDEVGSLKVGQIEIGKQVAVLNSIAWKAGLMGTAGGTGVSGIGILVLYWLRANQGG